MIIASFSINRREMMTHISLVRRVPAGRQGWIDNSCGQWRHPGRHI